MFLHFILKWILKMQLKRAAYNMICGMYNCMYIHVPLKFLLLLPLNRQLPIKSA